MLARGANPLRNRSGYEPLAQRKALLRVAQCRSQQSDQRRQDPSSKPRKNANRAAAAQRLAAQSAMQSKTAIGAFIRRIKSRLGAPTAINAGAHKLARLVYRMLKFGKAYVETGQQAYEKLFKERTLRNLQRRARELGFDVTPMASTALVTRSAAVAVPPKLEAASQDRAIRLQRDS